jgi:hypothetical protein
MKNIIAITYKTAWHGHHTHYANENRYARTRIFSDLEEARAFAKTVEVIEINDRAGRVITL